MRIKALLKKKNRSSGWYKPEITPDRKLDLLDDAVLSMARSIRWMNEHGVPFSSETYSALISDYSKCARLNWSLTPAQRLVALKVITARTSKASLAEVLRNASKQ